MSIRDSLRSHRTDGVATSAGSAPRVVRLSQAEPVVQQAIIGNVGTLIVFRIGAEDTELLEREFRPRFSRSDLLNLGFAQVYLKLMIDGTTSPPFSAATLPPLPRR